MENPLVSIIVITYNSAKFVLETLESAKAQTYQNIELIISDDGSQDETVELCEKWLAKNKDRFIDSQIITVEQNSGIPANCNRGVKASKGEWIKLIAGDDVLLGDCIETNITVSKKDKCEFIISNMCFFSENKVLANHANTAEVKHFFSKLTSYEKYQSYLRSSIFLNTPSFFYSRKLYDSIDGFDEQFHLLEDKQFIIKALKSNYNIRFLNKETVKYRLSANSISGKKNLHVVKEIALCNEKYVFPMLKNGNLKDKIFYYVLKFKDIQNSKSEDITFRSKLANKIFYLLRLYS